MEICGWRKELVVQLNQRRAETKSCKVLIETYCHLTKKIKKLEMQNQEQASMIQEAVDACDRSRRTWAKIKDNTDYEGLPEYQNRLIELECKLERTRQELTDSYKLKGEQALHLLDLNELARQKTEKINELTRNTKEAQETIEVLEIKYEDSYHQKLVDKTTIQRLTDDCQALSLELAQKDTEIAKLRGECNRMESVNMELVQQYRTENDKQTESMHKIITSHMRRTSLNFNEIPLPIQSTRSKNNSFTMKYKFKALDGDIYRMAFSSDGSLFATGGNSKTLNIWETQTGQLKHRLGALGQHILSVGFNPLGNLALGACSDNCTYVYNLETDRKQMTLTGHIGKVSSAVFSQDSTKVITGSYDRTIKMFDVSKGICNRTIFSYSSCNDLLVLDNFATEFVSGHVDNQVRVWDSKSRYGTNQAAQVIAGIHHAPITSLALSPDKTKLLTNSRDNTLNLIDLRTYHVISTYSHESYNSSSHWAQCCFSPDGKYVVAGGSDGFVYVWNTLTHVLETRLEGHGSSVSACAWNWVTNTLVTGEKDQVAVEWIFD